MADMLSRQGNHVVADFFDPASPGLTRLLEQRAGRGKIDKVVIVGGDEALLESVCFAVADMPALVCVGFATSTTSALMTEGLNTTRHPPFLPLVPSPMSDWCGLLKRLIDIVVVVIALPLMAPLLLLVAAAIRLESRGPVLFRQRVEKDLRCVRNWSLGLDLRILTVTVLGRFASPRAD